MEITIDQIEEIKMHRRRMMDLKNSTRNVHASLKFGSEVEKIDEFLKSLKKQLNKNAKKQKNDTKEK